MKNTVHVNEFWNEGIMENHLFSQSSILKISLYDIKDLPEGEDQYPLEYIEKYSVIKLKEDDDYVFIGICNVQDISLIENLRNFHKKNITFYEIDKGELTGYLSEKLSSSGESGTANLDLTDERHLLDKLANDAPIINLVNSIIIEGIQKAASDIHIECFSDEVFVRYRIDGNLKTVQQFEKQRFSAISSRIKIMANLNIMEKRLPQDGRITVHLGKDMTDMRVSIIPIESGESIVLRLFNKKQTPLQVHQLGIEDTELQLLKRIINITHGLILLSGPTGSGKTTTLNALLEEVKSESVKIITIEDPIEYVNEGINQIQTNEKIGLSFDTILRRILRQDPDIIMVGEIRDSQTAELAIRAALTGHLVFSTLHTQDSISIITRLQNMGIQPYLITAVLRCSLAQRLVRRICKHCIEKKPPSKVESEILSNHGFSPESPLYFGKGCSLCNNTGYRERVGIFELFKTDEELEEMIIRHRRESELRKFLLSNGMRTLIIDGLQKAVDGVTTISEVERAVFG